MSSELYIALEKSILGDSIKSVEDLKDWWDCFRKEVAGLTEEEQAKITEHKDRLKHKLGASSAPLI